MKSQIEITKPAPVLNTPDFHVAFGGLDGCQIPKDTLGLPLHFEFVALPGMQFEVIDIIPRHHHFIYHVHSESYPAQHLYIDSRFTRPLRISSQEQSLPSRKEILSYMESLLGTRYVWGGNWSQGIPELLHLYPPKASIDEETKTLWTLKGVDCSGLLYEATKGLTPRNTSHLIHVGKGVPIAGLTPKQLATNLEPLDIVVWPGHLFFVLNSSFSIESKRPFGVIQRPLLERLEEVCRERKGLDVWKEDLNPEKHFVVRRLSLKD